MSINLLTQSKVSPVELTLPSGESVAIPRCGYMFSPWRGTPILDTYGGKAVLDWNGNPVFAELAILGVLERAGWDGVWVDTYRRKFRRSMPPECCKLPSHALFQLALTAQTKMAMHFLQRGTPSVCVLGTDWRSFVTQRIATPVVAAKVNENEPCRNSVLNQEA